MNTGVTRPIFTALLAGLLGLSLAPAASAQEAGKSSEPAVDDIVAQYLEAIGGLEANQRLKTRRLEVCVVESCIGNSACSRSACKSGFPNSFRKPASGRFLTKLAFNPPVHHLNLSRLVTIRQNR